MIISKFGGSSVINIDAIKNIKLLAQNKDRRVLVFSAIGKSNQTDIKVTDLLISAFLKFKECGVLDLAKVRMRFCELKKLLKIDFDIDSYMANVKHNFLTNQERDYLVSRGEDLTARMYSKYLDIEYLSSEEILFFKGEEIDFEKTRFALEKGLNNFERFVTGGFYGCAEDGKIKVMSRGGGDKSGAIFARLTRAKEYEIFTDVDGIKTINPKWAYGETINTLSYADLNFMTSLDASVVHADCGRLLKNTNCEMIVKNALDLNGDYTRIGKRLKTNKPFISFDKKSGNFFYSCDGKRRRIHHCDKNFIEFVEKR